MARMTRKELLKDDQFIEQAKGFSHWLEENWRSAAKWAAAGFVALLLVLAGVSWFLGQEKRNRLELAAAIATYDRLDTAGFSDEPAMTALAADLQRLAGTAGSGKVASYYRGALLHRLGRTDEALEALESVAGSGAESTVVATAQGLMTRIWIESGNSDEAVAYLSAITDGTRSGYPVDQALLALGRIHKSRGEKAEARRVLQRVVDEFPASAAVTASNQLLAEL